MAYFASFRGICFDWANAPCQSVRYTLKKTKKLLKMDIYKFAISVYNIKARKKALQQKNIGSPKETNRSLYRTEISIL